MFILDKNSPLILTKLTDLGRKSIADGALDYVYWSIGDSEIDYDCVSDITLKQLKPVNQQPNLKHKLKFSAECNTLIDIESTDLNLVKSEVYNDAKLRGFFDSKIVNFANVDPDCTIITGQTTLNVFDASKTFDLSSLTAEDFALIDDGDIIVFKFTNPTTGDENIFSTAFPVPYLFFELTKSGITQTVSLDRPLPFFAALTGAASHDINFYVLPGKDKYLDFYSPSGVTINWNKETLEFEEECVDTDVKVWFQNNVYCENLIGTTGCTEEYTEYGSKDYIGAMKYLGYCDVCDEEINEEDCEDKLINTYDNRLNQIAIIHFSNYNTKNEYGEFLYIDTDKFSTRLKFHVPTIMWHGRWFGGSTNGDNLGMTFVSSGDTQTVSGTNITYYDLVEDEKYIETGRTPIRVGRVYPNLKLVTIDHADLLAAMTYKSNRNWTLPRLKGKMIFPTGGVGNGILAKNKTMYLTYVLESDDGIQYSFPQMIFTKFVNNSQIDRDISFQLEDLNFLPYMKQLEASYYDGFGFYADSFKILYQIVDNGDYPEPDRWLKVDFTQNVLKGGVATYTLDPLQLENQVPENNNFILTKNRVNMFLEGFYSNDDFCIPCTGDTLSLGDERLFFGNIETKIGATIYKSVFNLKFKETDIFGTQNDTYSNGNYYFNEIGIYNSKGELVLISKLSQPIEIVEGSTTELEISLDF
jgi:hypothetical protein